MPHRAVARMELAHLLAVLAHPLRLALLLELRADRRDGRHVRYRLALDGLSTWLDGGLALLEDETAHLQQVHDAIALARRDFGKDP
jgi:hypothetical protein